MPIQSTSTGPRFYAELRKQLSINDFVTLDEHAHEVQDARPWSAGDWWSACSKMLSRANDPEGSSGRRDDMLLCVPLGGPAAAPLVAVRLPPLGLPEQVSYGTELYSATDWRRTCFLNLALQSEFRLTLVGTRAREADTDGTHAPTEGRLAADVHAAIGREHGVATFVEQRRVYARTSKVPVARDCSVAREAQPRCTYPALCFALDDFDTSLRACALEMARDHFICVLEVAQWIPEAPRPGDPAPAAPSSAHPQHQARNCDAHDHLPQPDAESLPTVDRSPAGDWNEGNGRAGPVRWLSLFTGWVRHEQLRGSQQHRLPRAGATAGPYLLLMRGPEQRGVAETAISIARAAAGDGEAGVSARAASLLSSVLLGREQREPAVHFYCRLISLLMDVDDIVACLLRDQSACV